MKEIDSQHISTITKIETSMLAGGVLGVVMLFYFGMKRHAAFILSQHMGFGDAAFFVGMALFFWFVFGLIGIALFLESFLSLRKELFYYRLLLVCMLISLSLLMMGQA